jgi:trimeric autotransporter adhesin
MRLFRVALSIVTLCIVTTYLVYGAFALAQTNGQPSPTSTSTVTVPRLIQIKGSVRDTGKPLTGTVGITFTLYKDADDQVAVWQEIQNVQLDSAGRYTVLLGATKEGGLPLEIFSAGEARWLGVRPDGQAEQPRILLLSVAYALKAADTEMLGGRPASSYVLAESQNPPTQFVTTTQSGAANSQSASKIPTVGSGAGPLAMSTENGCATPPAGGVGSMGAAAPGTIALFTGGCDVDGSIITQSGTTSIGIAGMLLLPAINTATMIAPGFNSQPLDLQASSWSGAAVTQDFRWQAEPANPSLNLLFGSGGSTPAETGLSIGGNGQINFASGQAFPIPDGTVTNGMLANHSITVTAGSGLTGGGAVALGGTITLTNTAPSSGGTVTSVATGTGLTGGTITNTGTLSLDTTYTNAHYLQLIGGTLTGGLAGTNAAFTGTLNVAGNTFIGSPTGGLLSVLGGAIFAPLGTATTTKAFPSAPLDLEASTYFPGDGPVTYLFRWQSTPVGNNSLTVNPGATLNLLYGVGGLLNQTGLSVAGNGILNFAPGQTYPGLFLSNAQNSAYTTTASDFASCSTIPVASGTFAITLVASSSQPPSGECVFIVNYGSGVVTIAGNGQNLNGSPANLTLAAGSAAAPNGAFVVSDGANYVVQLLGGGGGVGTGTVTSVGLSINGSSTTSGIFAVNSGGTNPVTSNGTLNIALSGTTGGIPYFSSSILLKSSGALAGIVRGGSPPSASEISGDASTSGSNALIVKGLNGTLLSSLATGLLKNTTGVPSIATSSDIVSLFTGCSGSQYLGADGHCHAASGSGTVTSITANSPLTGTPNPIATSGTIGLMSCTSAGQTWIWNGTTWACGAAGGGGISGSGNPNGIAFFSSATNLTSTLAPINGQILIGSTGNVPVLGTLTAGTNVSITNTPGSITISASGGGGSPTLPFFATAAQRTGANQAAGHNLTKVWGFLLPYNVTTTQLTYDITTADNTANNYDLGIYDNSGHLVLNIGATPGTTFAPSKIFKTMAWAQGSTNLVAGRYYIAFTTSCASACAAVAADTIYVSFAINASAGTSVGGALPTTMTPPADNWGTGNQPMLVLH